MTAVTHLPRGFAVTCTASLNPPHFRCRRTATVLVSGHALCDRHYRADLLDKIANRLAVEAREARDAALTAALRGREAHKPAVLFETLDLMRQVLRHVAGRARIELSRTRWHPRTRLPEGRARVAENVTLSLANAVADWIDAEGCDVPADEYAEAFLAAALDMTHAARPLLSRTLMNVDMDRRVRDALACDRDDDLPF